MVIRNLWAISASCSRLSLPILLITNTRRANKERLLSSPYKDKNVMRDCADFLKEIIAKYNCEAYIGGYKGCIGDGYTGKVQCVE